MDRTYVCNDYLVVKLVFIVFSNVLCYFDGQNHLKRSGFVLLKYMLNL